MLSWLFKKRGNVDAPIAPPNPAHADRQAAARRPAPAAAGAAGPVEAPGPDWPAQLQAAAGDEAALLRIAQTAPVLQVKMAAVEALISEGALKSAEREFRSHDRKVHRLAKQRLEAAITTRLARAKAQTLLERTTVLMGQALVPVNHVVELDRDWLALPANALEPGQSVEFAERRARLDSVMRERDAAHLRLQRWTADAKRFLLDWQRAIHATAEQGSANDATVLGQAVQALRQARPEVAATAELDRSLAQAQQSACLVEARLARLEAQPADAADPMPPAASVRRERNTGRSGSAISTTRRRWRAPAGSTCPRARGSSVW